jgi:hypothetical protein
MRSRQLTDELARLGLKAVIEEQLESLLEVRLAVDDREFPSIFHLCLPMC